MVNQITQAEETANQGNEAGFLDFIVWIIFVVWHCFFCSRIFQTRRVYQIAVLRIARMDKTHDKRQSEKQDEQAIELFEELKKGLEPGSYLHKAVIVNLLEIKTMEQEATAELIAQLRMAGTSKDKEYFNIYSNYFEKQKFSQQDLLNYKEDKMFPFFKKYGYIKDTRQLSQDLAAYYKQQGKWEKAHYYQTQFLENGGE